MQDFNLLRQLSHRASVQRQRRQTLRTYGQHRKGDVLDTRLDGIAKADDHCDRDAGAVPQVCRLHIHQSEFIGSTTDGDVD